ncbi:MAG: uncharacterized protein JWM02_1731 [Frankiales bacterium]|nr:uncharacterized protein [Frankiales bacterium]
MAVRRVRFGPERTTLAVVVVMALGALPLGLSSPYLAPVLLVPVLVTVWVLRARVVAADIGLEVCNGLRVRRFRWQDVAGFDIPRRGPVVLLPTEGRPLRLTALPRNDLKRLLEVGTPA